MSLTSAALGGDTASELRSQVNYVAAALTAGNASDAMTPFSKSFADHDKLANYFAGLTGAFNISNEVDFANEQNSATECRATVHWAITLSDLQTNNTEQRSGELSIRLTLEKGKWKIIEFTPLTIFNPSRRT